MKELMILLFSTTIVWGQKDSAFYIGAGVHYNKYPSQGFENYVIELSKVKNVNLEYGLNSRLFFTQNNERIDRLDPLFESQKGDKYFQFQQNVFLKYYPFEWKLSPFIYGEIGYQITNSKSRNFYLLEGDTYAKLRPSYIKPNMGFGLGLQLFTSSTKKLGFTTVASVSNNKVKSNDLKIIGLGYNYLFPVYNLSFSMNYLITHRNR